MRIVDLKTGGVVRRYPTSASEVEKIGFSSNGQYLGVMYAGLRQLEIFDCSTKRKDSAFTCSYPDVLNSFAFHKRRHDNTFVILAVLRNGSVYVTDSITKGDFFI